MRASSVILVCACSFGLPINAHAIQIFKVIEEGLQKVAQAQLNQLKQNVGFAKEQLDVEKRLEKLTDDSFRKLNAELSGSYDMSKIYNGALDQAKRRWGPMINGVGGDQDYLKLRNNHNAKFAPKEGREIFSDNSLQKASYEQSKISQEKSIVSAHFVSQSINNNIDGIEKLIAQIDQTPNQKASTDLNSRIQGQVALELVELKRLQALLLESIGSMTQQSVVDQNVSAEFNQWA
jgi:hypothetical protein|tara:strand:+ start:13552 stop:14256 length:705 start_codon:yes stop_codon:yes gene_type:complete